MAYIPQSSQPADSNQQLKALPVVVLALMGGMVTFAGLATYMALTRGGAMQPQGQSPAPGAAPATANGGMADIAPMLFVVCGVLTGLSILAFWGLGRFAVSNLRKSWTGADAAERERKATVGLVTTSILRAGFAEGAGLFAAVVVLLTGSLYPLGSVVIAAVLLVMLLPVRSRLEGLMAEAAR